MLVCAFNYLPNRDYSNHFNAAALLAGFFSGKKSSPVKKLYLLTFPDNKE